MRDYDVDLVSAYRFDRTGEPSVRIIYTFFYNLLIRRMFGVKARDINFAFKLCRARLFDHVDSRARGRSSTPNWSSGPPGRGTRCCSSASTTSADPAASRRSALPGVIVTILREMWALRGDLDRITPVRDADA